MLAVGNASEGHLSGLTKNPYMFKWFAGDYKGGVALIAIPDKGRFTIAPGWLKS